MDFPTRRIRKGEGIAHVKQREISASNFYLKWMTSTRTILNRILVAQKSLETSVVGGTLWWHNFGVLEMRLMRDEGRYLKHGVLLIVIVHVWLYLLVYVSMSHISATDITRNICTVCYDGNLHTHIREMVPDPQQQETPVTSNKKTPEVPRNSLLVPPIEKPVAVIHRGVSKI